MAKASMIINFEIDEETLGVQKIDTEEILNYLRIEDHNAVDGFEIVSDTVKDIEGDRFYCLKNPKIVSRKIIHKDCMSQSDFIITKFVFKHLEEGDLTLKIYGLTVKEIEQVFREFNFLYDTQRYDSYFTDFLRTRSIKFERFNADLIVKE